MMRTILSPFAPSFFAGIGILVASPVLAETAEILPVADNTLFETDDGSLSSGIGANIYVGLTSEGNLRRGLIAFDVAAALPANAVVDSVSLRLRLSRASEVAERVLTAHRVLASWGEGQSSADDGRGAPSMAGDATWIHRFFSDVPWATVGGDFAATASATAVVQGVGFYELKSAGLTDDVRAWFADPGVSFGWLLRGAESVPGSARRFDSRENSTDASRPRLFVHYHPGPDPVLETSWGRIKASYQ